MSQTVGERLKFVRVSKGLTQAELGAMVGCTGRVIGACERGDTELSNDMMANICKNVGVSADFLLLGKDVHTARMQRLVIARDNTTSTAKTEGGYVVITTKVPVLPELEGL